MLGIEELKERIEITETTVECPVRGCSKKVQRQRKVFKRDERFKCPRHNIYISPSTFEYQREVDNLLWSDDADLKLFEKIKIVKRENRIARDNSEDAVTWNIFRFLENNHLIDEVLRQFAGIAVQEPEVMYWSYARSQNQSWDMLKNARTEFEIVPAKGSEPDVMVVGKDALMLIESKLTASNKTHPSNANVENKYLTGGHGWWSQVFSSDFRTVAMGEEKYELSRFWLLGTWIAEQRGLNFYLINLVLAEREQDIEQIFKKHIYENQRRRFIRITWEDIYHQITTSGFSGTNKDTMVKYFNNKTIGYDENGILQKAFALPKGGTAKAS